MATTLRHLIPVINGFLRIPDAQITFPTNLTIAEAFSAIPGCKIVRIGPAGMEELDGYYTLNDDSSQRLSGTSIYLALPGWDAPGGPSVDYFKSLRDLATNEI